MHRLLILLARSLKCHIPDGNTVPWKKYSININTNNTLVWVEISGGNAHLVNCSYVFKVVLAYKNMTGGPTTGKQGYIPNQTHICGSEPTL